MWATRPTPGLNGPLRLGRLSDIICFSFWVARSGFSPAISSTTLSSRPEQIIAKR
jgi:hypothetical protein